MSLRAARAFNPGNVSITGGTIGTGTTGVVTLLAQSYAAVSGAADTNENALGTITVPANTLGANGGLRIRSYWTFTNSANNKTLRVRYSTITGTQYWNVVQTTTAVLVLTTEIFNRNLTNSQVGNSFAVSTAATGAFGAAAHVTSAVDTTASTTVILSGQKASAGETITLEGYTVEVIH